MFQISLVYTNQCLKFGRKLYLSKLSPNLSAYIFSSLNNPRASFHCTHLLMPHFRFFFLVSDILLRSIFPTIFNCGKVVCCGTAVDGVFLVKNTLRK